MRNVRLRAGDTGPKMTLDEYEAQKAEQRAKAEDDGFVTVAKKGGR